MGRFSFPTMTEAAAERLAGRGDLYEGEVFAKLSGIDEPSLEPPTLQAFDGEVVQTVAYEADGPDED